MLTRRQSELLTFIVRERSEGREPGTRAIARALTGGHPQPALELRRRLLERVPRERIEALVPRAPDGARLRFIPVE